jgi:hypothetical protein
MLQEKPGLPDLLHYLLSTGYKLKIVERGGTKLEDLLHRSDPCQGQDCDRPGCLLCSTKQYTGKNKRQECSKRNLVYQTYCITCKERDSERIKEMNGDNKKSQELIKNMKIYKYIGETSRSCYERSQEHQNDMEQLKPSSHFLRHALDQHEGEKLSDVRFGMEIIKNTRTSFERQILESVCIQQNTHHHILNSRSEYNRCSIPRLSTRLGDKEYKKYEKGLEEEKEKEEMMEKRIREMRKMRNKNRKPRSQQTNPAPKRRKTGQKTFTRTCSSWISQQQRSKRTCQIGVKMRKGKTSRNPPPRPQQE